jgi:hypothetical protein
MFLHIFELLEFTYVYFTLLYISKNTGSKNVVKELGIVGN